MIPKIKSEIVARITELKLELNMLESINTSCQHCEYFTGIGCKLAGDHLPPPDVLENGCLSWTFNEVPF
jgi:hypothetical protein